MPAVTQDMLATYINKISQAFDKLKPMETLNDYDLAIATFDDLLTEKDQLLAQIDKYLDDLEFVLDEQKTEKQRIQGDSIVAQVQDWSRWLCRYHSRNPALAEAELNIAQTQTLIKEQQALRGEITGSFLFSTNSSREIHQLQIFVDDIKEERQEMADDAAYVIQRNMRRLHQIRQAKVEQKLEVVAPVPAFNLEEPSEQREKAARIIQATKSSAITISEPVSAADVVEQNMHVGDLKPALSPILPAKPTVAADPSSDSDDKELRATLSAAAPELTLGGQPTPFEKPAITRVQETEQDDQPKPQPIVAVLYTQLNRLQSKALNSQGFNLNRFWHAQYQEKADNVALAINTLKESTDEKALTDEVVINAIKDPNSSLSQALNMHTGHLFGKVFHGFTITTQTNGITSLHARAYLNMLNAINESKGNIADDVKVFDAEPAALKL